MSVLRKDLTTPYYCGRNLDSTKLSPKGFVTYTTRRVGLSTQPQMPLQGKFVALWKRFAASGGPRKGLWLRIFRSLPTEEKFQRLLSRRQIYYDSSEIS